MFTCSYAVAGQFLILSLCLILGLAFVYGNKRKRKKAHPRFEDLNYKLQKMTTLNMDQAPNRRRVREAFKKPILGIDHCMLKMSYDSVEVEEFYEKNSKGLEIFSKSWLPKTSLKAVVCYCHGTAKKLASCGYGVFALDYPGFGLSEGLNNYIPNFDMLVDDVIEHFSKVKETKKCQNLPSFLLGHSMGGAVALKVHLKQPNAWDGAVLLSPMCKIADDILPHWIVKQLLIGIAKLVPTAKLVPQNNLQKLAYRDLRKRKLNDTYNVLAFRDNPRLKTAIELLNTAQELEHRLKEVSLPMSIQQGESDFVTDPSVSKTLYEKANSSDKRILLYKDACHALLEGEPDEMIFQVVDDIITWLDQRSI
ncbi:hypothetical protein IFM89_016547 [Coptis chinensis]|uniref:Serine aminopeptidase S33 domain-containing protein n=1 Tax=Coptis chinensis TaxID=261450 RepID=A0A835I898_9MAGN|nr:hypothetical protein IFM89_016547 [Coptis chinensis]